MTGTNLYNQKNNLNIIRIINFNVLYLCIKKEKIMTKKFLIKSLLPYKNGTKPFGFNGRHCTYLTDDGNTCAIGQYMKTGHWQLRISGVQSLFMVENECEIMTDEWLKQKVPIMVAVYMQRYHDILARNQSVGHIVRVLERLTGFNLPELNDN